VAKFVLTAQLQLQAPKNVGKVVNQIQQQLKGINVDVEARGTATAKRQIEQVRKETDKAAKSADNMGKAFSVSIRRFTALAIATRAVSLFSNSLGGAVKEAISFERELVKISQVTGKTMSDLRGLTDTITNLSTRFGVASSSLLNVSRILSQAGFDAKQTEIALSTLARTELAPTFDDITQTAEGAVAIFNQFRRGAEALESQLGSINAVAGKFAVEAGDLISVVRRAGGVFKASGGQLNELIALFTSVRSTTRESADSIATGLRTIFTRIQRPKTIEYLKQFGVELIDLEGKFVGPFEASMQLGKALAGLEQGDTTFIKIAEELGGFRQIGKVIPLLQQTRVAQEALNVAQGGANSLAGDAAAAQQTLAVRLDQTQQKFIALIRSISETYSFQLMANAALAIADSIVKIGEAIKPVLPLITALAAVKLAKGFGLLGGGLAAGGVKGFASGGVVPGTGNGDTVPAMLTPGEFVIKKQSVNKIGADRLASMNRYASGGKVNVKDGSAAGFFLSPEGGMDRNINLANEPQGTIEVRNRSALQKLGYTSGGTGGKDITMMNSVNSKTALARAVLGNKNPNKAQLSKFSPLVGKITPTTQIPLKGGGSAAAKDVLKDTDIKGRLRAAQGGGRKGTGQKVDLGGTLKAFFPGKNDIENSAVAKGVDEKTGKSLGYAVRTGAMSVIKSLQGGPLQFNKKQVEGAAKSLSTDNNALSTTSGFVFEGIIQALTGAKLQGNQSNWDFLGKLNNFGSGLGGLFSSGAGAFKKLIRADAKRTNSSKSRESIIDKIESDINKGISAGYSFQKKAAGGSISGVGTDTVPALLTPGEFVVNRKSAQSIGYGSLNRMNKVGKYAKGGVVQKFNKGTTGPRGVEESFIGPDTPAQNAKAIKTAKTQKNLAKLGVAAFATTTALSSMIPAAQETDSALLRMARGVTDATTTTVGSVGALGFALQGLGENFSIGNLIKGKFTGPLIGAGASAMFISSAFESVVDSTNKFNRALKEGTLDQALGLATQSSTSGIRSAGSLVTGAVVGGGLAAIGAPLVAAVGAASVAVLAFNGIAYNYSDTLQDIASQVGAETSNQIKATVASQIATRDFTRALSLASERAAQAFKNAEDFGNFEEAGEETFADSVKQLKKSQFAVIQRQRSDLEAALPANSEYMYLPKVKQNFDSQDMIRNFLSDRSNTEGSEEDIARKLDVFIKSNNIRNPLARISSEITSNDFKDFIKAIKDQDKSEEKVIKESAPFVNQAAREASIAGNRVGGENIEGLRDSIKTLRSEIKVLTKAQEKAREGREDNQLNRVGNAFDGSQLTVAQSDLTKTTEKYQDALIRSYKEQLKTSALAPSLRDTIMKLPKEALLNLALTSENIGKEIKRLQDRFELINFGLNSFTTSALGANLALKNYTDRLTGGATDLEIAFRTIEAGLSANANAVSGEEFNKSLDVLLKNLQENNTEPKSVIKAGDSLKAGRVAVTALQSIVADLDPTKNKDLQFGGNQNKARDFISRKMLESFSGDEIGEELKLIVSNFKDMKLPKELTDAFAASDVDGFNKALSSLSSDMLEKLKTGINALNDTAKIRNGLLKDQIALENKLQDSQRGTLKSQLEMGTMLSKFGGSVVSTSDRLKNLGKRLSVGSPAQVSGSAGGITSEAQRISAIVSQSQKDLRDGQNITTQRRLEDQGAEASLKRLSEASRELIKIQQDEYNIIQQKNALERQNISALMRGDVDSLFKNFQTNTAIGIASSGDGRLAGQLESEAFANAFDQVMKRREIGENSVNGQDIDKVLRNLLVFGTERSLGRDLAERNADKVLANDRDSVGARDRLKLAADSLITVSQQLESIANQRAETANKAVADSLSVVLPSLKLNAESIASSAAVFKQSSETFNQDMSKFNENIQQLAGDGIKLKSEQKVDITLMGGELLQEIKRFDSKLVADEIAEAFSRAKIDDNGKITLG
jgi:TP901 family phage tail tape measure protein